MVWSNKFYKIYKTKYRFVVIDVNDREVEERNWPGYVRDKVYRIREETGKLYIGKYDAENIDAIMGGRGDWFTAKLLRLIAKADVGNLEKIRRGFPAEVMLYEWWMKGSGEPMPERLEIR